MLSYVVHNMIAYTQLVWSVYFPPFFKPVKVRATPFDYGNRQAADILDKVIFREEKFI